MSEVIFYYINYREYCIKLNDVREVEIWKQKFDEMI